MLSHYVVTLFFAILTQLSNSMRVRRSEHAVTKKAFANAPEDERYAFAIKYNVQNILGVRIAHTALLVCERAKVTNIVTKFDAWCQGRRGDCFFAKNFGLKQPLGLLDAGCQEYEFADDTGVRVLKYGESDFYTEFTTASPSSTHIYPVGPVSGSSVANVFDKLVTCGKDGKHQLDYNSGTYNFLLHNCHTFTDTMMHYLDLPKWSTKKGLPSRMMPEETERNPVLSRVVKGFVVNFMDNPGPVETSKWCKATGASHNFTSCSSREQEDTCMSDKVECFWDGKTCMPQCGTIGYKNRCMDHHYCKWVEFLSWCTSRCSAYVTEKRCSDNRCNWKKISTGDMHKYPSVSEEYGCVD